MRQWDAQSKQLQSIKQHYLVSNNSYKNAIIETIIEIVSYQKDRFKVRFLTFEKYRKYCNRMFCIFKTEVSKQMFRNHWVNNYKSKISNYSICNLSEVCKYRSYFKDRYAIYHKQLLRYFLPKQSALLPQVLDICGYTIFFYWTDSYSFCKFPEVFNILTPAVCR